MHMVSDHFVDANKDIFILKRQTDAANNTQLTLDGTTPLATNTPPLANDSVAFALVQLVFGQEASNNTYVYAANLIL